MKRSALKSNYIFPLLAILWSFRYQNPLLAGIGVFVIIYTIYENKKFNIKLYLILIGTILVTSLILSFIKFSSPSYHGNILLNSLLAIFFISWVILHAYDITHDYNISKIFEMKDQQLRNLNPFMKNIFLVIGIIISVFVAFLLVNYIFPNLIFK